MTSRRMATDYLADILDAMQKAQHFIAGVEFRQFAANDEKVFAVIRAIEIIGEATRQIPRTVRARHAEVPWKEMAGMRDKLIHDYSGVDLTVVWETVTTDIPQLMPLIVRILNDEQQREA